MKNFDSIYQNAINIRKEKILKKKKKGERTVSSFFVLLARNFVKCLKSQWYNISNNFCSTSRQIICSWKRQTEIDDDFWRIISGQEILETRIRRKISYEMDSPLNFSKCRNHVQLIFHDFGHFAFSYQALQLFFFLIENIRTWNFIAVNFLFIKFDLIFTYGLPYLFTVFVP